VAKDGKPEIVPRLRFPAYRSAGGWDERLLGLEGEFLSPLAGKSAQQFGIGSAKYVTYMNVFSNTFTSTELLGAVDVAEDESQNLVKVGDVLFTVSSETPEEVGMSSVVLDSIAHCYLNSFCAMFRFADSKRPNLHFLGYQLRQQRVRKYFTRNAQGSTRFNLSRAVFHRVPIAIPSPGEQKKIADCLTSLDEVIAAQGRKVEALKKYKRGLMQQLFPREGETVPRLRFPEFCNAPEWAVHPFEHFVLRSFYGTSSSTHDKGAYPVLRMGNMVDGGLDFSDLVFLDLDRESFEHIRLRRGDILLNRTNSLALVGKISLFDHEVECIAASYIVTYRLDQERLRPAFCSALLNGPPFQVKIKALARPSVSQANINPTTFRKELFIPIPAPAEQDRVSRCLAALDALVAGESEKLTALKTHKDGLMQQLFPSPQEVHA
jgi:type I restriction enzyme, S subunit